MTNEINDGGPAFPGQHVTSYRATSTSGLHSPTFAEAITEPHSGMSLRDYFAAFALQGFLACSRIHEISGEDFSKAMKETARVAYEQADAMLKAREDV